MNRLEVTAREPTGAPAGRRPPNGGLDLHEPALPASLARRMLKPGEVIHDGGWAQVGRLRDESGRPFIRKVGKYLLDGDGLAVLDFLAALAAEPHPNLLAPLSFS